MKRRPMTPTAARTPSTAWPRPCSACAAPREVRAFLEDLCTPAELEAMTDRWRVVPLLLEGVPYREIHDRTRVSVTTIGRVARTPGARRRRLRGRAAERPAGGRADARTRTEYSRITP